MTHEPIRYRLGFPDFRRHLVRIEATISTTELNRSSSPSPRLGERGPAGEGAVSQASSGDSVPTTLELMMPTWTPGSYLIREYARQVESIAAFDAASGESLKIEKTDKAGWRVSGLRSEAVRIVYTLYCRELSVRTNWIDEEFAFLTGAATFITRVDALDHPHVVEFESVSQWPYLACSLPPDGSEFASPADWIHSFMRRAESYHELVDSPMLLGYFEFRSFDVGGKAHFFAHLGHHLKWDTDRAVGDCRKIVEYEQQFWGDVPYPNYWFINLALEGYGGLEHDNNTVLLCNRWAMTKPETYREWLGLVAHEFFHTWNVRRLRPKSLKEYDYRNEQYLEELWIAEGITSYYDDLILARTGLAGPEEFLGMLNKTINTVEDAPGRLVQSLRDSSWDTWIKHYRPDENSANSRISYYTKGAVVAFLLDVEIRKATDNRCSLDDVMRELWSRFLDSGYTLADFEGILRQWANRDMSAWFHKHIRTAESLDFRTAFDWLGLERVDSGNGDVELGCESSQRDGRWVVTKVLRDGPAGSAGLQVDDELIAIDGWRLPKEGLKERLQQLNAGELCLTVARRGRLKELSIRPTIRRANNLRFAEWSDTKQLENRRRWLSGNQ